MAGTHEGPKRVGRKASSYRRSARRVDERHARAAAKRKRGPQKIISISTYENTGEWAWFQRCGTIPHRTRSRVAREALRGLLADDDQSVIIESMRKQLAARIQELEYRDAEIRELRHASGFHANTMDPLCESCSDVKTAVDDGRQRQLF